MPDIRHKEVQQAVADAFIANGGNAEQALISVGYSKRYARGNSYKIMANSGVREFIERRNGDIANDRIADMTEINQFWTEVMRDSKADPKDRLKASELRAKAAGGFIACDPSREFNQVIIVGGDCIAD